MKRYWPAAGTLLVAASVGLGGCGSVLGGGETAPLAAASPAPSPSTPTAPQTPPQPLAFPGATVAYSGVRGTQFVGPANPIGDLEVTITEPDTPQISRLDQVNFSGNETIRIRQPSAGFDQVFPTTSFQAGTAAVYADATTANANRRNLEVSRWTVDGPSSTIRLRIYKLSEVTDPGLGGINPLEYVRVGELRPDTTSGTFLLFGLQTAPADMFRSGTLHYDGEATGQYINTQYPGGREFVSRVSMDVDFGRANNQVTGRTFAPRFVETSFDTRVTHSFDISFQGTIAGSTFSGTAEGVDTVGPLSGAVEGAFYGPSTAPADEIGGVFAVTSPTSGSKIAGGFVGGR